MQSILDHWLELATTALLGVIAINTVERNSQILVTRQARRCVPSQPRVIGVRPPSGGRNEMQ
jgi:hypothetical protein